MTESAKSTIIYDKITNNYTINYTFTCVHVQHTYTQRLQVLVQLETSLCGHPCGNDAVGCGQLLNELCVLTIRHGHFVLVDETHVHHNGSRIGEQVPELLVLVFTKVTHLIQVVALPKLALQTFVWLL